ncbi:MAG: hypothetical protein HPAVJP_0720 [Candidatus Hepatoplasma vulgare]|nr:MAG: hypothetical protein HPAVJP_0720 [Candidatus Hepatoplasma sp.]
MEKENHKHQFKCEHCGHEYKSKYEEKECPECGAMNQCKIKDEENKEI